MSEELPLNLDGMLGGRKINRFKVTEGSHTFRILPPFGTNHQGVPSRQIQLHWGYSRKDGSQSPLPCSYPHEKTCPICDMVKGIEGEAKRLYNPETKEGDKPSYDKLMEKAGRYRVRRSWLLNAANKKGEVGILELVKTPLEDMVKLMKSYQTKYGKNPVSLSQGIWFTFTRSGKRFDTEYETEIAKRMVKVGEDMAEMPDTEALASNIVENYAKLAYDIHKMYPAVKSTDLARIMKGEAIDDVIVKQRDQQAAKPAETASTPVAAAAAPAAPATTPEDLDDVVAMLNQ